MSLLLDTPDSGTATLEQVLRHVEPAPERSKKYQAVQNKELIDMVKKAESASFVNESASVT